MKRHQKRQKRDIEKAYTAYLTCNHRISNRMLFSNKCHRILLSIRSLFKLIKKIQIKSAFIRLSYSQIQNKGITLIILKLHTKRFVISFGLLYILIKLREDFAKTLLTTPKTVGLKLISKQKHA